MQVVPPQVHAPFEHACPVAHLPQALPPAPQVSVVWPARGTQVFWLQHPPEHEVVVHSQTPALPHTCPVAQPPHVAPPVPHWPAP